MDALKARFGDHTDAIFKRHNMNSVGYWVPEDAPSSRTLCSPFSKVKPNPESETLSKQSLENKRT